MKLLQQAATSTSQKPVPAAAQPSASSPAQGPGMAHQQQNKGSTSSPVSASSGQQGLLGGVAAGSTSGAMGPNPGWSLFGTPHHLQGSSTAAVLQLDAAAVTGPSAADSLSLSLGSVLVAASAATQKHGSAAGAGAAPLQAASPPASSAGPSSGATKQPAASSSAAAAAAQAAPTQAQPGDIAALPKLPKIRTGPRAATPPAGAGSPAPACPRPAPRVVSPSTGQFQAKPYFATAPASDPRRKLIARLSSMRYQRPQLPQGAAPGPDDLLEPRLQHELLQQVQQWSEKGLRVEDSPNAIRVLDLLMMSVEECGSHGSGMAAAMVALVRLTCGDERYRQVCQAAMRAALELAVLYPDSMTEAERAEVASYALVGARLRQSYRSDTSCEHSREAMRLARLLQATPGMAASVSGPQLQCYCPGCILHVLRASQAGCVRNGSPLTMRGCQAC